MGESRPIGSSDSGAASPSRLDVDRDGTAGPGQGPQARAESVAMHENDLVTEALETLRSLRDGEQITAVEVALGPGVDRAQAARAWRAQTEHTPFEAIHVTWEQGLDLLRCEHCEHEYTGDELDACPYCGGDGMMLEAAVPMQIGRWSGEAPDLGRA